MEGYGDAKVWGLDLARDLVDWRAGKITWDDVDRGVILSGQDDLRESLGRIL